MFLTVQMQGKYMYLKMFCLRRIYPAKSQNSFLSMQNRVTSIKCNLLYIARFSGHGLNVNGSICKLFTCFYCFLLHMWEPIVIVTVCGLIYMWRTWDVFSGKIAYLQLPYGANSVQCCQFENFHTCFRIFSGLLVTLLLFLNTVAKRVRKVSKSSQKVTKLWTSCPRSLTCYSMIYT